MNHKTKELLQIQPLEKYFHNLSKSPCAISTFKQSGIHMCGILRKTIGALAVIVILSPFAEAQQLAKDFVITNRATKIPIRRDDFKGKILFLDFFAYWCGPCRTSSPLVEKEIAEYYKLKGGNPHGVKVEVVGVNIESNNPSSTDSFISEAGFDLVADDFGAPLGAWAQFGAGGIPHFVVINGTSGGSHAQWEVLHSGAGFRGSTFYRSIIDSVKPGSDTQKAPEIVIEQPYGNNLVSGSVTRSYGSVRVSSASDWKNFVIKNRGTAPLTGIYVTKSGGQAADFEVAPVSWSSIAPGASASVRVRFRPKANGVRNAVIRIYSNDTDENPFIISLTGRGSALRRTIALGL